MIIDLLLEPFGGNNSMFVSVIMAVYNGEDYLQESIQSILHQTHRDFEFIIVNDGSTDQTKSILDQLKETDNRIQVIHLETNKGVSHARNTAVQHAKAEWIAVQDDDDISLPNRLQEQVEFIENVPNIVAVCTFIKSIPGSGSVTEEQLMAAEEFVNSTITFEQILQKRFRDCVICCGTAMFSKKSFQEVGGYTTGLAIGEDYELFLFKLLELGHIEVIPKILYHYRIDPNSVTRDDKIKTCSKLNLVSLSGIRNIAYRHFSDKPRIAVIGSIHGCVNFQQRIEPYIDFNVSYYLKLNELNHLNYSCKIMGENEIDGIILIENTDYESTLTYLINNGLVYNRNLFSIASLLP